MSRTSCIVPDMDSFPSLLKTLGSVDEIARRLNVTPDAVRKMGQRHSVPPRHWPELIFIAHDKGLKLTLEKLARIATEKAA